MPPPLPPRDQPPGTVCLCYGPDLNDPKANSKSGRARAIRELSKLSPKREHAARGWLKYRITTDDSTFRDKPYYSFEVWAFRPEVGEFDALPVAIAGFGREYNLYGRDLTAAQKRQKRRAEPRAKRSTSSDRQTSRRARSRVG